MSLKKLLVIRSKQKCQHENKLPWKIIISFLKQMSIWTNAYSSPLRMYVYQPSIRPKCRETDETQCTTLSLIELITSEYKMKTIKLSKNITCPEGEMTLSAKKVSKAKENGYTVHSYVLNGKWHLFKKRILQAFFDHNIYLRRRMFAQKHYLSINVRYLQDMIFS